MPSFIPKESDLEHATIAGRTTRVGSRLGLVELTVSARAQGPGQGYRQRRVIPELPSRELAV